MPGHIEGALAIARAAIDAAEFAKAREALSPFVAQPTQRVAMLMAELERTEHGDSGRARAWTMRAVRALHDPAWTADGYVSDRWRPVSPVTGRLDAFQWQTPVAALPSDKGGTIESSPFEEAMLAAPVTRRVEVAKDPVELPKIELPKEEPVAAPVEPVVAKPAEPEPAAQDNTPPAVAAPEPAPVAPPAAAPRAESAPVASAPLFRARTDLPKAAPASIPAVIPLVRAPDDPGIDEDGPRDEFADQIAPPVAQVGGWRGFLSRWGN